MPRVATGVFSSGSRKTQQTEAKKFLEGIGVREVGEVEEIERILNARYIGQAPNPSNKTHLADMRRFIDFIEKHPDQHGLFKNAYIFKRERGDWSEPGDVFLDEPYKETLLSEYFRAVGNEDTVLSDWYFKNGIGIKKLSVFAEAVGCITALPIERQSTEKHQKVHELRQDWYRSNVKWTSTAINEDWQIEHLEVLKKPSIALARLIWSTLIKDSKGKLWAKFRPNQQYSIQTQPSSLVLTLRDHAWIPQKDGSFVTPKEATRDGLLEGFPFDAGDEWLRMIEFGEEARKRSAESIERAVKRKQLGFDSEEAYQDSLEFSKLSAEQRKQVLNEIRRRQEFELPENEPSNLVRRSEMVAQQAKDAPEKQYEERTRLVAVNKSDIKARASEYLRDQYTHDGQMICQISKDELPFRKNNGEYYFETTPFISGLTQHHDKNYLALCPNHAAMFEHANGCKELLKDMLLDLNAQELEVVLAQQDMTIYFTKTHILDLKAILQGIQEEKNAMP